MSPEQLRYQVSYWDPDIAKRRVYGSASDKSGAAALRGSLAASDTDARNIAVVDLHEKNLAWCRSCQAPMVWLKTAAGKNCPVDIESWSGEIQFDSKIHISHFATCPHAAQHRSPR